MASRCVPFSPGSAPNAMEPTSFPAIGEIKRSESDKSDAKSGSGSPALEQDVMLARFCEGLSLDATLRGSVTALYQSVRSRCVLEGEEAPWLAAALYSVIVSQRLAEDDSFQAANSGCPSLNRLLEICDVSVLEFADKSAKWLDMLPEVAEQLISGEARMAVREQFSLMHSSLAVAVVLYRRFALLFRLIFRCTADGACSSQLEEDESRMPFYAWILFCTLKKSFSRADEDVAIGLNLLLSVLDTITLAALQCPARAQWVNPEVAGWPCWSAPDYDERSAVPFLAELCHCPTLDAKLYRTHTYIPKMRALMSTERPWLVGRLPDDIRPGLLDTMADNLSRLDRIYGDEVAKRVCYDERELLPRPLCRVHDASSDGDAVRRLACRPAAFDASPPVDAPLMMRTSTLQCLTKTELEQCLTSGSELTSLQTELKALVVQLTDDETAERFFAVSNGYAALVASSLEESGLDSDKLSEFFESVKLLYIRFLLSIIKAERIAGGGGVPSFTRTLMFSTFHRCVFAAAVQVILFLTVDGSSEMATFSRFRLVLDALSLQPIQFWKVIELIVRSEPYLSRRLVSHFSDLEERVLEQWCWEDRSSLWMRIDAETIGGKSPFPSSSAVLSGHSSGTSPAASTIKQDPLAANIVDVMRAKRRLDFADSSGSEAKRIAVDTPDAAVASTSSGSSAFGIFLPKVYSLIARRLSDLCDRLKPHFSSKLSFAKVRSSAWCLLENLLRHKWHLLRGRHLDQFIACAVHCCCVRPAEKAAAPKLQMQHVLDCLKFQRQFAWRNFEDILIDCGPDGTERRGQLSVFYSEVFAPALLEYLEPASTALGDTKPQPTAFPSFALRVPTCPLIPPGCDTIVHPWGVRVQPLQPAAGGEAPSTPSPGGAARRAAAANNTLALQQQRQLSPRGGTLVVGGKRQVILGAGGSGVVQVRSQY